MPEEKHLKVPKILIWQLMTLVFAVLLLGVLVGKISLFNMTYGPITAEEAGNRVVKYINENLIQSGSCSLVTVNDTDGLYKVVTLYQGNLIPVYVTKDGKFLFVSQPIDLTKPVTSITTSTQTITKSDKPTVELYVMSFCPYGIQAENLMKPAFDLLGEKAEFKVRFIASVAGNTVDSIKSLHGTLEAQEDLRQLCIQKYYDAKTFWKYLSNFNSACASFSSDSASLERCWKSAATKYGIDTSKIETCASGSEGINLLKEDEKLVNQFGISGSPTILINSVRYEGVRSSESFKSGICSAFITSPSECSQTLSSSSGSVSGGC